MRNFSLFLLLATSAMPALAQRGDDGDRQSRRASQSEQSENRAQRAERPQRAERAERPERSQAREQRQIQVERPVQNEGSRTERIQHYQQQQQAQQGDGSFSGRVQRHQRRADEQQVQDQSSRNERLERFRQRRLEGNPQAEGGALVPRSTRIRPIPPTRPEIGQTGPVRHDVRSGRRVDRHDRHRWANHWRHDRRYDWRRHRDRNRFIFRIGFYSDPFGYNYRRLGLGSYLYPSYYHSNYWINDPWQYRLPPAYGPYRWVRYHNDALLIDIYSGEVVDVIHGFFW